MALRTEYRVIEIHPETTPQPADQGYPEEFSWYGTLMRKVNAEVENGAEFIAIISETAALIQVRV